MKTTTTTHKDYSVKYHNWDIVVPAGSVVTSRTACGQDESYHFWEGWQKQIEELTGCKNSILVHDLTYYGLNIPKEYCNSYKHD